MVLYEKSYPDDSKVSGFSYTPYELQNTKWLIDGTSQDPLFQWASTSDGGMERVCVNCEGNGTWDNKEERYVRIYNPRATNIPMITARPNRGIIFSQP